MMQLIPYYAFCNKIIILTAVYIFILISGKRRYMSSVLRFSHQPCTSDISSHANTFGFGAIQLYHHHFKGSLGRTVSSP